MKVSQSARMLLATTALVATVPAHAQEASTPAPQVADDTAISDIVVTAQRRDENLQKTSIVLDVVGQAELTRAGVTTADDISRVAPGIISGTTTGAPQIYIRGVGDFAAVALNNPAVALNVDGVYSARPASLLADFYDLERVEVLKGPQGTLYGRNASGGAINLITARPKLGEFGGKASIELGNYNAVNGLLALNIPIGDTFAIRASGNLIRRDGFTSSGFNDARSESVRVRALWKPSDAISLLLNFSYGHNGARGQASVLGTNKAGLPKFTDNLGAAGRAYITSQIPNGFVPGVPVQVGPDLRAQVVLPDGSDAGSNNNYYNVSAQLDANLGFATLTVIPSYRRASESFSGYPFVAVGFGKGFLIQTNLAAPPSPANQSALAPRPETSDAYSIEARLSNETDKLKWVVGGLYFDEKQYSQYTVFAGPIQNIGLRSNFLTQAYGLFAQATFSVSDPLRIIGGIRYTSDKRTLANGETYAQPFSTFGFAGPNGATFAPPTPPGTFAPYAPVAGPPFAVLVETYSGSKVFTNVSWKAGIEYDIAPDSLFFATASSGFKAGGFNQISTIQAPGKATPFEPEKLTSYDVGIKNRFLDNRLQLNVGAFYWDYRNQQVNRFGVNSAGGIGIEFVNAQKATIYGGNIDIIAKPWRGMTLNASVEYSHSKYDLFVIQSAQVLPGATSCTVTPVVPIVLGPAGPIQNVDCSGKQLARAPEWSGSMGFAQDFDLSVGGRVTVAGDVAFASSRELSFDYVAATRADAYAVFNASIGYTSRNDRFSILAFIRNIGNEEVFTGGASPNFAPGVGVAPVQLPRTYGVRLGVNF